MYLSTRIFSKARRSQTAPDRWPNGFSGVMLIPVRPYFFSWSTDGVAHASVLITEGIDDGRSLNSLSKIQNFLDITVDPPVFPRLSVVHRSDRTFARAGRGPRRHISRRTSD